jgi:zinc-binding alcohol dehydrogenase family protein
MTDSMRAVGFRGNLPADDPSSLVDLRMPIPAPGPHDLLVQIHAASVNPVDTKIRRFSPTQDGELRILGFDAAGTVIAVGSQVSRFATGDDVFYAGVTNRPGSNAEFQLVDERIVGRKPATLDFAQAASLPLTTITAWESLFGHLALGPESAGTILVVGAAGGAGSMATQLARARTRLDVVATASRPESAAFAVELGAHHVVDHTARLAEQVAAIAPDGVDYVFSAYSPGHVEAYAELVRPLGHIVAIDRPGELDVLQRKSITWHFELMFTRPLLMPEDDYQHRLLEKASELIDAGVLRPTATVVLDGLQTETLRKAHRMVESLAMIGKVVIDYGSRPSAPRQ